VAEKKEIALMEMISMRPCPCL